MPRPSKEHTESWGFDFDGEKEKDLDYIPTKEQPVDLDELYAKVDKSNTRASLNDVFPTTKNEKPDENGIETKRALERTMSDITEDKEVAGPHVDKNHVNGVASDLDSDDYTELDEIIHGRTNTQDIKVDIEKQGKTLGEFLETLLT